MSDGGKEDALIKVLREIKKERKRLERASIRSADFDLTQRARGNAREDARESAVHIRRLEHEAHCLAVEMGIADIRGDDAYGDFPAPAGFGRTFTIHLRRPVQ